MRRGIEYPFFHEISIQSTELDSISCSNSCLASHVDPGKHWCQKANSFQVGEAQELCFNY